MTAVFVLQLDLLPDVKKLENVFEKFERILKQPMHVSRLKFFFELLLFLMFTGGACATHWMKSDFYSFFLPSFVQYVSVCSCAPKSSSNSKHDVGERRREIKFCPFVKCITFILNARTPTSYNDLFILIDFKTSLQDGKQIMSYKADGNQK